MGRIIAFDTVVQDKINDIFSEKGCHTGLIIGQITLQKDIAIRLCPTPCKDEHAVAKTEKKGKSDIDLDEEWICLHAKQVTRALPGGLDILGFYIASPSDRTAKLQAELKQILLAVYKTIRKMEDLEYLSNERVLLSICTQMLKCSCRTLDITDYKNSLNPAEWKFQAAKARWHSLQSQFAIDLKFPIRLENRGLSLRRQIQAGLSPLFKSVLDARALINKTTRSDAEFLDVLEGKKTKQKVLKVEAVEQIYDVEIFLPLEQQDPSDPEVYDCACMMTFKGVIHCQAYAHGKATVKEAIDALKKDILRSVRARCEIHCEDLLLIEEEQQDPLLIHELPKRVFAPLPQSNISVCDYQFHGDTPSDSLDAFKELLDLEVEEDDVDTTCEVSPVLSALILPDVPEDRLSEFGETTSTNRSFLMPVAGAAIAAVAAGLSYVVLLGTGLQES